MARDRPDGAVRRVTPDTLTLRQLNRATLARQMLLAREEISPREVVQRLVGLQAQEPRPPFVGLWSRSVGFERDALRRAYHGREIVRATLMRGTLHTFTADDYAAFRATLQPVLSQALRGVAAARSPGLELERVLSAARAILAEGPRTFNELRPALAERFPEADERILGLAVRMEVPLVMIPTEDRWAFPADSRFGLAETWLGQPLAGAADLEGLVIRYLAAFGPATAADAQTWSGLAGLKEVLHELRPRLRVFRDERGRELFDLPAAPRPEADLPAPPRFLPEFDNLLLSHADRRRVLADEHKPFVVMPKNLRIRATFLIDGFVAGTWRVERKGKRATLRLAPFAPLPRAVERELLAEGEALLRFVEEGADSYAVEGVLASPAEA
jgi:hypothetical protein